MDPRYSFDEETFLKRKTLAGPNSSLNAIFSSETMRKQKLMSSQYTKAMPYVKFQGSSIDTNILFPT